MNAESTALVQGEAAIAPLMFRLQPGGKKSGSNCFINCAKCEQPAFIRRSERLSATVTQLTCHCTNSGCGHIFAMDLTFVHSLVEGNIDRPDLNLPVCDRDKVKHVLAPARGAGEPSDDEPMLFAGSG